MECVGTLSWGGREPAAGRTEDRSEEHACWNRLAACVARRSKTKPAEPREAAWFEAQPETATKAGFAVETARPAAWADRTMSAEGRLLEPDGAEVVRRARSGDSGAWAEMVRTHQKRVYGLCYRFTGNAADAEDLTQDVFLKIYMNLASFDAARGSLPVWIATMTRNLLVDNFRRTRNLRVTNSLDEGWDRPEEPRMRPGAADRLADGRVSPHEAAAQGELRKMVEQALRKVSQELREAVILRDLQDLDYKEIAEVLSVPEGTVKSRISRGRAELARLLERNKREGM